MNCSCWRSDWKLFRRFQWVGWDCNWSSSSNPPSPHVIVIRFLLCLLVFFLFKILSYILVWFVSKIEVNKSIGTIAMTKSWNSQEYVMVVGKYVKFSLNWARMQCVRRTPRWIYFLKIVRYHMYPLNYITELLSICYHWWMEFVVIHILQMWISNLDG
jgi:hypothetical protein